LTSPKFKDKDGLGVGSTFAELFAKHPNLEAYGSEIEARVHVVIGSLIYRLDMNDNRSELDEDAIPGETKIMYVTILVLRQV
jgi:hypothetical protein